MSGLGSNVTHSHAMRIIPYAYDQEKKQYLILLGLDRAYHEWSSLGGKCKGGYTEQTYKDVKFNSLYDCLNRELMEESRNLLTLKSIGDLEKCKYIEYTESIKPDKFSIDIHNRIYFVECSNTMDSLREIITKHASDEWIKEMEKTLSAKSKSKYHEMGKLELVTVSDDHFGIFAVNTIKDINARLHPYTDIRYKNYVKHSLHEFLKHYSQRKKIDHSTDDARLDIHLLTGLIVGLNNFAKITIMDVDELISALVAMFKSDPHCQLDLIPFK